MNVTERYVELLATEGYRPKVDEDDANEIQFSVERARFRLTVDPNDEAYVAISLDFRVDEGHAFGRLLTIANELNGRVKVVKTLVHPEAHAVRFSFETLVRGTMQGDELARAVSYLRHAADEYFGEVGKPALITKP